MTQKIKSKIRIRRWSHTHTQMLRHSYLHSESHSTNKVSVHTSRSCTEGDFWKEKRKLYCTFEESCCSVWWLFPSKKKREHEKKNDYKKAKKKVTHVFKNWVKKTSSFSSEQRSPDASNIHVYALFVSPRARIRLVFSIVCTKSLLCVYWWERKNSKSSLWRMGKGKSIIRFRDDEHIRG